MAFGMKADNAAPVSKQVSPTAQLAWSPKKKKAAAKPAMPMKGMKNC